MRGGPSTLAPSGPGGAGRRSGEEAIMWAERDLDEVARGKFDFDAVGHYSRPDVFQLKVNEEPQRPVG